MKSVGARLHLILALLLLTPVLLSGCASVPRIGLWKNVSKEEALDALRGYGPVVGAYRDADLLRVYRALNIQEGVKSGFIIEKNPYRKLFHSNDIQASQKYLRERLHGWTFDSQVAAIFKLPIEAFAANIGPFTWQIVKLAPQLKAPVETAFTVPLETLKRGFYFVRTDTNPSYSVLPEFAPIIDYAVLLHEARHSDCPVPPTEEEYGRLRDRYENILKTSKGNPAPASEPDPILIRSGCFHFHTKCVSPDQGLGKLPGCDPDFSGAYSVMYAVMIELADHCLNCSDVEKIALHITALQFLIRVNPYPAATRSRVVSVTTAFTTLKNATQADRGKIREVIKEIQSLTESSNRILIDAPEFSL